ncbi:hypothetical protein UT300019_29600 [Clostridium sp. CTA-19]
MFKFLDKTIYIKHKFYVFKIIHKNKTIFRIINKRHIKQKQIGDKISKNTN